MIFASIIHFGSGIINFFFTKIWQFLVVSLALSVTQWLCHLFERHAMVCWKKTNFWKEATCKSCFLFVKWNELDMNVFVLTSYCLNAKFCFDPHNFSSFFQVNRLEYKPQWPASGRDFCVIAILREIDEGVIALASEAVCALSVIFYVLSAKSNSFCGHGSLVLSMLKGGTIDSCTLFYVLGQDTQLL